ncbi:hypothetical protein EDC01DRAFT_679417 [Geopyxis carbonaria]|nr:hypothetical protein EDC01DRAFT_679417 [Geopyxis carbonaria]
MPGVLPPAAEMSFGAYPAAATCPAATPTPTPPAPPTAATLILRSLPPLLHDGHTPFIHATRLHPHSTRAEGLVSVGVLVQMRAYQLRHGGSRRFVGEMVESLWGGIVGRGVRAAGGGGEGGDTGGRACMALTGAPGSGGPWERLEDLQALLTLAIVRWEEGTFGVAQWKDLEDAAVRCGGMAGMLQGTAPSSTAPSTASSSSTPSASNTNSTATLDADADTPWQTFIYRESALRTLLVLVCLGRAWHRAAGLAGMGRDSVAACRLPVHRRAWEAGSEEAWRAAVEEGGEAAAQRKEEPMRVGALWGGGQGAGVAAWVAGIDAVGALVMAEVLAGER